jgi:hypothetical protein
MNQNCNNSSNLCNIFGNNCTWIIVIGVIILLCCCNKKDDCKICCCENDII